MSRRSAWLDPTTVQAAVGLAILAAIANGVWILIDDAVPSWDQSHYLSTTLQYKQTLAAGGPIDLLRAIYNLDPGHGPLYTTALLPFVYIFGASASSALVLNLILAPVLYFSCGQIAWIVFRRWQARLLTIVLVAAMPLMVGLFHNVLVDFLLVTLAALSLLLLLQSEGFQRRWTTWAMALVMALGTLTKVTFPAFVAGPLLVIVAQVIVTQLANHKRGDGNSAELRQLAINLGGAAVVFAVVAFAWYGPNFSETLDYVRSTTSGPLSEGAGPEDPLTFDAITSFTTGVVNFNLSWVILGVGLVAVALNAARVRALVRRPLQAGPLWKLGFLLAWALIPYLSVATAHNQDVRLMAPALPAVAILVAGAICAVPQRQARLALAGVAVVLLGYQTLNHVTDVTPGFMPDRVRIALGDYEAAVQLDSAPIGYEQLPGEDFGTPVIEYMEEVSLASPGGLSGPRTVCLLQSEATMNSNTLGFLSLARGDPFVFADVVSDRGGTERGLEEVLSGCNYAVYVPQAEVSPAGPGSRLEIVNEPYAANHMTPRLLRLFRGPGRSFPLSDNAGSEGEPEYLSAAGNERVQVLVRTPGEGPVGG